MAPRRAHQQTERDRRVGRRVRTLRLQRGEGQTALADRMNDRGWTTWTQGRVSTVESGTQSLRLVEAEDVAASLEANLSDLLDDFLSRELRTAEVDVREREDDADLADPDVEEDILWLHEAMRSRAVLRWLDQATADGRVGSPAHVLGHCTYEAGACSLAHEAPAETFGRTLASRDHDYIEKLLLTLGAKTTRRARILRSHASLRERRSSLQLTPEARIASAVTFGVEFLDEMHRVLPALSNLRSQS